MIPADKKYSDALAAGLRAQVDAGAQAQAAGIVELAGTADGRHQLARQMGIDLYCGSPVRHDEHTIWVGDGLPVATNLRYCAGTVDIR